MGVFPDTSFLSCQGHFQGIGGTEGDGRGESVVIGDPVNCEQPSASVPIHPKGKIEQCVRFLHATTDTSALGVN